MQIAIGLFSGFTALDALGPYEVFANLPRAEVVICGARTGPIGDEHCLVRLDVTTTFDDVPAPDVAAGAGRARHQEARTRW